MHGNTRRWTTRMSRSCRPGCNATGFMSYEYSMGGKRLELLKQIAPGVTRAAVLRDATQGSGTSEFAAIQAVAPSFGVEVHPVNMREGRGDGRDIRARSSWLILMSGLMGFCLLGGVLALIYKRKMVKPPPI